MRGNSKRKTPDSKLAEIVPRLLRWFVRNARDLPWRHTRDPYAIWISEVMLQQTQVKTVIPYWERWMRRLPTVEALARARPERVLKLWEGLGYYTRARNLQRTAKLIVRQHDGTFPETFDAILALPGIGRYTAGAICSIAFNQPAPVLDGNVIRVLTRLDGIEKNPREKRTNARLWRLAEALVLHAKMRDLQTKNPQGAGRPHEEFSCSHLNQSLMELGATICTPRSPDCAICPVRKFCVAHRKGLQEKLPDLGRRTETTPRRFLALVVERDGKFLVRRRPAGGVNARLWEFPNIEINGTGLDLRQTAKAVLGVAAAAVNPLCTVKHSITRYRITLDAYRAQPAGFIRRRSRSEEWLPPDRLASLAFTSAHRKVLDSLLRTETHKLKNGV